jgi:cyclopropane-fatty-acyl-phospholipid synthase
MVKENLYEKTCREILKSADVKINGKRDWDIQVHNPKTFKRVLSQGTLGLGEAYMDGWWDCKSIDKFIDKVLRANLDKKIKNPKVIWLFLRAKLTNPHRRNAFDIGEKHYDLGNDLFSLMLDKRMVYTCGYWKNAKTLDQAQEDKLRLTCEKLGLRKGMKVLDIGCGWGSFLKYAAENYGISGVGVTVSKEQVELGKKLCKGLPIEIRLQDYADVNEKFDRIVSLGMFEHVGSTNYRKYMKVVDRCLKPKGLFLLHTIGTKNRGGGNDPWIHKYIFPEGSLPSADQITNAIKGIFILEDWHNFGPDYDKTLMAWHKNLNKSWPKLQDKYSERFKRMWDYFLLSCAGGFRARSIQLWQIVLSKGGVDGGYKPIR